MPLIARTASEADIAQAVDVYHAAFGSTSPVHWNLFPHGATTASTKERMVKGFKELYENPIETCLVMVDTESNDRVMAWLNWKTFKQQQPEDEWNKAIEIPELKTPAEDADYNSNFEAYFFGNLGLLKRDRLRGKPRVHIGLLITHPDYQRRGCGKMLLDRCGEHASQLGLPTILEASPFAAKLYLREGFIPVENGALNLRLNYKGEEIAHSTVMMERPAKSVLASH